MKHKKRIAVILALVLIMLATPFSAFGTSDLPPDSVYIDEPYDYPVKPGTDSWWALPQTLDAKIEASQIPEDVLQALTTRALAETVLDYPLLPNMWAFDSFKAGFDSVLSYFNGLQELVNREDSVEQLAAIIEEIKATGAVDTDEIAPENYAIFSRYADAAAIMPEIEKLNTKVEPSVLVLSRPITITTIHGKLGRTGPQLGISLFAAVSITTPGGASVSVIEGYTWEFWWAQDNSTLTLEQFKLKHNAEHLAYPTIYSTLTILSVPSPVYNCHNYAWRTTGQTDAWMLSPVAYWGVNGGYSSGYTQVGSRVYYSGSSHSAIVITIPVVGSAETYVRSKWGRLGVYSHAVWDCPYPGARTSYNLI